MLKVGKIEYLNTVPVYYGFLSKKVSPEGVEFVEDVPSELNRMIRDRELDVSVVSSYEYLKNSENYLLLPDVSISAECKVASVLFLSAVPVHQLHEKDVWITKSSMTSRELLKFLLNSVYGVKPKYYYYSLKDGNLPKKPTALLVIGDDAFRLLSSRRFPFKYDLAQEWFNLFKLPFVFAVWVARADSFKRKRKEVLSFCRKLLTSRDIGENSYEEICSEYGKRLGISPSRCREYLENLNFHLGEREIKSMQRFSEVVNLPFSVKFLPACP